MQNQQSEKMPKAMLRVMFALVVFILIAVSVARVSGLSLVGTPPQSEVCLLYTSPSPRDGLLSRMQSSA